MSHTLSIPFINTETDEKSITAFSLNPYKSTDDIKKYNEYCHKFKQFICELLMHICDRHIYDDPIASKSPSNAPAPTPINSFLITSSSVSSTPKKLELWNKFVEDHNYVFMERLNQATLSSIIQFVTYHLNNIDILDKYKILNTLYLVISPVSYDNSLIDVAYHSLISFIMNMLSINETISTFIQKQHPNTTYSNSYKGIHDGNLDKLWQKLLYLLLKNGANPLLPNWLWAMKGSQDIIDIKKIRKYIWCFHKNVSDNFMNYAQNYEILDKISSCGQSHKYDKLIIDIINKYPLSNTYSTPYLRPSVFTFCTQIKNDNSSSYVREDTFCYGGGRRIRTDIIYSRFTIQEFINLIIYSQRSKIIQFVDKNKLKFIRHGYIAYDIDEMMDLKNQLNKYDVIKEINKSLTNTYSDWGTGITINNDIKTLLFTIKEIYKYIKKNTIKYLTKHLLINIDIIKLILNDYVWEDLSYLDNNNLINQNAFLCCWFGGIRDCPFEWFEFFRENVLNNLKKEQIEYLRKYIISKRQIIDCINRFHSSEATYNVKSLTERLKFMFKITNIKYFDIPFIDENIGRKIRDRSTKPLPQEYWNWEKSVGIR